MFGWESEDDGPAGICFLTGDSRMIGFTWTDLLNLESFVGVLLCSIAAALGALDCS